jgi:hypothetical protein
MSGGWAFHCSACGRCCNSGPRLTVPELFAQQGRFIGALALRVRRPVGTTPEAHAASSALLGQIAHPLPGGGFGELFMLALTPGQGACPALLADGRCACHGDGKPLACCVVPLDASLPDAQQAVVLARRATGGPEYLGIDCIAPAPHATFPVLIAGQGVAADAAAVLAEHRAALQAEKRYWGDALAASLPPSLWQALAASGEVAVLPPAPVLLAVAEYSSACRERCLDFASAQVPLLEAACAKASTPEAASLAKFLAAMHAVQKALAGQSTRLYAVPTIDASAAERWLNMPAHRQEYA